MRSGTRPLAELDEVGVLGVVDDDAPAEAPAELRARRAAPTRLDRPPREPAGDEQRLRSVGIAERSSSSDGASIAA